MTLTGPYDGQIVSYRFGTKSETIRARSLAEAVQTFAATTLYPAVFAADGADVVRVFVAVGVPGDRHRWSWEQVADVPLADILVTDVAPATLNAIGGPAEDTSTTALAKGANVTHRATLTRAEIHDAHVRLAAMRAELEAQAQALTLEMATMEGELRRRRESLWLLGTYLGTSVAIREVCGGTPAPVDTPITVRQRVLCMDEEIAVTRCLAGQDVAGPGAFDWRDIRVFDGWLASNLDTIFPWPKGVWAMRVRRQRKDRANDDNNIFVAMANAEEAMLDEATYLYTRNGQRVTRITLDADLWPRLLPSEEDVPNLQAEFRDRWKEESKVRRQKHQFAGMLAIQGLLAHTEVLHPLPGPVDVMDPRWASAFVLLRDDEGQGLLEDGTDPLRRVTWAAYENWLITQVTEGCAVWYRGPRSDRQEGCNLAARTGKERAGFAWPDHTNAFTVTTVHDQAKARYHWTRGTFLYLPSDDVYVRDAEGYLESRERSRRVAFDFYADEVTPIHALSWRILRHILLDRGQREGYAGSFPLIQRFYRWAKATAEAEAPLVTLILSAAGADTEDTRARARVERLLRWWKVKVKEQRTLTSDEPKAYRMVLAAFRRGEDYDDPEVAFLADT